jgi:tetratricopeptide (TPR) repeat protein
MFRNPEAAKALSDGEEARRDNRLVDASGAFAQAVAILRPLGSSERLAHALARRAQIARDLSDYVQARSAQQEAVDIYRGLDDTRALAHAVRHLADILADAGLCEEAAPLYREMLELYNASDAVAPLEMANAIRSVAVHAERSGDVVEARRLWLEARQRYEEVGEELERLTGTSENPGVVEANRHLAGL